MNNNLLPGITSSLKSISDGGLALLKKIPLFGDYIRYQEGIEKQENAIDEKIVNEYKILNDPITQIAFINSFTIKEEREAVIGHILDVIAGKQKNLNIVNILHKVCQNIKNLNKSEVDNNEMDQDWWLLWFEKAQMTSNSVKQDILAKILEIENKKAKSITPRFIRVLADLTNEDIELFIKALNYYSLDGSMYTSIPFLLNVNLPSLNFDEVKKLAETDLISEATGIGEITEFSAQIFNKNNIFYLNYQQYTIVIYYEEDKLKFGRNSSLTRDGLILRELLNHKQDLEIVKKMAHAIHDSLKCKITIHKNISNKQIERKEIFLINEN